MMCIPLPYMVDSANAICFQCHFAKERVHKWWNGSSCEILPQPHHYQKVRQEKEQGHTVYISDPSDQTNKDHHSTVQVDIYLEPPRFLNTCGGSSKKFVKFCLHLQVVHSPRSRTHEKHGFSCTSVTVKSIRQWWAKDQETHNRHVCCINDIHNTTNVCAELHCGKTFMGRLCYGRCWLCGKVFNFEVFIDW